MKQLPAERSQADARAKVFELSALIDKKPMSVTHRLQIQSFHAVVVSGGAFTETALGILERIYREVAG